jgi:hypothetical protein
LSDMMIFTENVALSTGVNKPVYGGDY